MKGLIFMVHLWSLRLSVTSDLDGICNICAVLCSENACTTSSFFLFLKNLWHENFSHFYTFLCFCELDEVPSQNQIGDVQMKSM